MKELAKQLASLLSAGFAAACCLGVTAALSALTTIGAGFLINDAFLIPLYGVLLGLSLWLLHRSVRAHGKLAPFRLAVGGAVMAFLGLWLSTLLVYAGLAAMVGASVWDFASKMGKGH
jgi:mercuric ion transport protein